MRILLVNDTSNRENLGCRLTSLTLARSLRRAFADAGQPAEVVSAPWSFAPRLADPRLGRTLADPDQVLSAPVLRALAAGEYGESAVRAAEARDAVVFQPEGTISDDHGALRILRNLSLPLYALLHTDAAVAVCNGTFPLFRDARAAPIRLLLDRADHAALRDRLSAAHWGAGFAPDTAVLWRGEDRLPDGTADHLLLTTAAEAEAERDRAIARAALELCGRQGLRPLVLTKGWKRFDPFRREIESLGGRMVAQADLDDADALMARCRIHVGGRYHMALLCATKGVPSVLLRTNTHKNLWLAQEFDSIGIADGPEDICGTAESLLVPPLPRPALLTDIARCRALQADDMDRLVATVLAHRPRPREPSPHLDPATAALLGAESERRGWRARLGGWLGR